MNVADLSITSVEVSKIGKCKNGKMTNNGEEIFNV